MPKLGKLMATAAAALALCGGAQAALINFDSVGDTGTILFATTQAGASLNVTVNFELKTLLAGAATFDVSVTNASTGPGTNALMSFSIDLVTPTLKNAFANGIWDAGVEKNMAGGFQNVDLCVFASNGCPGGNINNGLATNSTSAFQLLLTTDADFTAGGITFTSPYGAKFQDVGTSNGSYEFAGCIPNPRTGQCDGGGGSDQTVPEPATLALAGLGLFAGLAASRRRVLRAA